MQSPPVDPRDREALAATTTDLARRYSGWQPPGPGLSDPGSALIGVFSHFAELVVERVNKAPERGFLSFLNLIGIEPLPPQPARVPLTFALAAGGTGTVVPAGTQVAAPADDDHEEESVFETDVALVITGATLGPVFVGDPENDTYGDGRAGSFAAFLGDRSVPHQLFVGIDPVLTGEGAAPITLRLGTTEVPRWQGDDISWAAWDGATWSALPGPVATASAGGCDIAFAAVPVLPAAPLPGASAGGPVTGWLRAQLDVPLATPEPGPPEAVGVGRRALQEPGPGLVPFGGTTQGRWFYLSTDLPPGALARVSVTFTAPGVAAAASPRLTWSLKMGNDWVPAVEFTDTTRSFLQDGEIGFRAPVDWAPSLFNGSRGRWLRVEVSGDYATQPVIETLTVDYTWPLPVVSTLAVLKTNGPATWQAPDTALLNGIPLDLSKDFLPFGDQPAFNDTLYLRCPESVARSGASFSLAVTVSNASGKRSGAPTVTQTPTISWETFDGSTWRAARAGRADAFTVDGDVTLTPAAPLQECEVAGTAGRWVRARLLDGVCYGTPAAYQPTGDKFTFVASTLTPPVVGSLTWKPAPTVAVPPSACTTYNDFTHVVRWLDPAGANQAPFQPFTPGAERDPALYLGFDRPFEPSPVTLYLPVEPPTPDQVAADAIADPMAAGTFQPPDLVWEYWGRPETGEGDRATAGWQSLAAVDETQNLSGPGLVRFVGPGGLLPRECFAESGFWLRLRWRTGEFGVDPRLSGVLPNTVWATQATTVADEVLGSGNGEPGQVFAAAQPPVLPGEQLSVRDADDEWVLWTAVPDLRVCGPADRCYTLDPLTGAVEFGDGRRGQLPPAGQGNVRLSYRTGGGAGGNRAVGTVTELKTALPYVDSVVNHESASGGAAQEPIERVGDRGPRTLRHRDRAVTAQDVEDLAALASPEVLRVKAVPPSLFDPYSLWLDPENPVLLAEHQTGEQEAGRLGVIVVPDSLDARPTPGLGLIRTVTAFVNDRCPATAQIWVAGPEWIKVTLTATVVPEATQLADTVRARVRAAVEGYLHPLTGGPAAHGWAFGRKPHRSDLFALIEAVPGVDHVRSLGVSQEPQSAALGDRLTQALNRPLTGAGHEPAAPDLQRWLDRALVYSGRHELTMTLRG